MSNPPTTLGKYQIIREIARSNDIVYEAYDPLMNRRVAIKELAVPGGSSDQQKQDRIQRFMREARAVGSLTHPNIMTVFEVGEEAGRYFIAMEYLDGKTLRNELDTSGFLASDKAIGIITDVLNGLEYAHGRGVIHRDIKPDNIQLLSDGRVKITDFGIARLTFEPNITMDGQVFGTPSYMSPEQVVGKDIDARSDVFSAGVVFYEMLAGQKPFPGDSVVSITYAIVNKEPDRPQQVAFPMWQVLAKALDKTPSLRYTSARDMLGAIDNAKRAVVPDGMVSPFPQPGGTVYQPGFQQQGYNPQPPPPTQYGGYMPQQPQQGYIAPPPVVNPYTNAPPPTFSYNPYAGGGQMGPPHVANPMGYTPNHAPIYYPPPPRHPFLKPEVKFMLGRILMALAVFGVIIAVIFGLINLVTGAFRGTSVSDNKPTQGAKITPGAPEAAATQPVVDNENQRLASQYEARGDESKGSDDPKAISNYLKAIDAAPGYAAPYAKLGDLRGQQARLLPDAQDRIALLTLAGDNWGKAHDLENAGPIRDTDGEQAARNYADAARDLLAAGNRPEARKLLYKARQVCPASSQIQNDIDLLLNQSS